MNAQILATSTLALLCAAPCLAQLRWDTTQVVVEAGIDDESAHIEFPFVNEGGHAVSIKSVRSTCGCTVAAPDKTTYEPGEHGSVRATLTYGQRTGTITKSVTVETDDDANPRVALTIEAYVPEVVRLDPFALVWRTDEERAVKSVRVRVVQEEPIEIVSARRDGSGFIFGLRTIEAGREYEVLLEPTKEAAIGARMTIELETDSNSEKYKRIRVQASLLPVAKSETRQSDSPWPSIRRRRAVASQPAPLPTSPPVNTAAPSPEGG